MSALKGYDELIYLYRLMIGTLEIRSVLDSMGPDIPPCIEWASTLLKRTSKCMCIRVMDGAGPESPCLSGDELHGICVALEALWDEYARVGNRLEAIRVYSLAKGKKRIQADGSDFEQSFIKGRLGSVISGWDDDEAGARALPTLRYLLLGTTSIGPFSSSYLDEEISTVGIQAIRADGRALKSTGKILEDYLSSVWEIREAARTCREAIKMAFPLSGRCLTLNRQNLFPVDIELISGFLAFMDAPSKLKKASAQLLEELDERLDVLEAPGDPLYEDGGIRDIGIKVDSLGQLVKDLASEFAALPPAVGNFWVGRIIDRLA